ncbi:SdrD B-like domain-containing protein [Comamonas serinivorans]|nr:SdrD B-like domain-containing protein [Comamonas serinivorans]
MGPLLLSPVSALAQSPTGEPAPRIEALDAMQAEQARLHKLLANQPAAYQDKVMDASALPSLEGAGDADSAPAQGLRQQWIESRYGLLNSRTDTASTRDHRQAHELGLRAELRQETLNWGEWILQADARQRRGDWLNLGSTAPGEGDSGTRLTLRNLGLPLTATTWADVALGDQAAEVTDTLRRSYRLMLGNSVIRGASARIHDGQSEVSAGLGTRAELTGNPYPTHVRKPGQLAWLGASHRWANRWFIGGQLNHASGSGLSVNSAFNDPWAAAGTSAALTLGFGPEWLEDGEHRVRAIALLSHADGLADTRRRSAAGLYLEGGLNHGGHRHVWGLYATQPQLFFGDAYLNTDNRGLYWRVDRTLSRLSWGAGLDVSQLASRQGWSQAGSQRQWTANGNAQYRIDRSSSVGLSVSVSQTRQDAAASEARRGQRSLYASGFLQTQFGGWAPTRFRVTLRRNQTLVVDDVRATGEQYEWEQEWVTSQQDTLRPEFTTTLGWARDRSSTGQQVYPTAGLLLRQWLRPDWQVSGNLHYTSRSGNLATSRGLSGSLSTELQLGRGWRAGAMLLMNQAKTQTTGLAGTSTAQLIRSNDKSFHVFVRWDGSDGQSLARTGQPGSTGAGRIEGTVYFDANRDGEQQASEGGVAGVEVLLDDRYRTTTDSAGRFEFPVVATGHHRLRLRLESVPLPWGTAQEAGQAIEVPLRGLAQTRIPVVRVGGE